MSRVETAFAGLILAQTAHSVEEYVGRLWESFPPARFITGLVSANHELGFIILNVAIVAFGLWCLLWPVRRRWPSATTLMWFWVAIESLNAIGHSAWAIAQGGYAPGVATAPLLLIASVFLGRELRAAE
jgi:hypothetical protein